MGRAQHRGPGATLTRDARRFRDASPGGAHEGPHIRRGDVSTGGGRTESDRPAVGRERVPRRVIRLRAHGERGRTPRWSALGLRMTIVGSGGREGRAGRVEDAGRPADRPEIAGRRGEEGQTRRSRVGHRRGTRPRDRRRFESPRRAPPGLPGYRCTRHPGTVPGLAAGRSGPPARRDLPPDRTSCPAGTRAAARVMAGADQVRAAGPSGATAAPRQEHASRTGECRTRDSPTNEGSHPIPRPGECRRSDRPGSRGRPPSGPASSVLASAPGCWLAPAGGPTRTVGGGPIRRPRSVLLHAPGLDPRRDEIREESPGKVVVCAHGGAILSTLFP